LALKANTLALAFSSKQRLFPLFLYHFFIHQGDSSGTSDKQHFAEIFVKIFIDLEIGVWGFCNCSAALLLF
jgi:hypothetical protein